jgi:hypothetical protein
MHVTERHRRTARSVIRTTPTLSFDIRLARSCSELLSPLDRIAPGLAVKVFRYRAGGRGAPPPAVVPYDAYGPPGPAR